ncbi:16952_t:CDS:2, partial [Racocetra fulgida]
DKFVEKCGTQPSFFVEQIVIKKTADPKKHKDSGASVLEKDLLLWTLSLQEKIANAIVIYPNQLSDTPLSTSKKYSLSDLCFKPYDSNTCLIHSPLEYWSNSADRLSSDPSILKTLSRTDKTSRGMVIPLNSVFGNVIYEKRNISADSIILTYFLKDMMDDCNEGQTIAIWEAIWRQVMDDIGSDFYIGGDRITSVLIFMVAVTNVYQSNIDLPPLKSALTFVGDALVFPDTRTNVTYWETSKAITADKFWGIVNPDQKNQFAEIRPSRHLTLSYEATQEINENGNCLLHDNGINWKFITNKSIKAFIWVLKFTVFPATGIAFTISFLVGFLLPEDMVIRAARLSKKKRNKVDRIILPASSSFGRSTLCVTTPRVVTLRGHHLADVDLICSNLKGIIVTTAADRHITSWNGKKGMPLKKLERFMRRCESCKCSSTGGIKNCISWPVRAMCMNDNIEVVAAGFEDGVVRVWDINSGQATYILKDTVEDVEQATS